jgi:integrase
MADLFVRPGHPLALPLTVGQVANQVAAKHAFDDYRSRRAKNTLTRQDNDLALFAAYLEEVGAAPAGRLAAEPEAWAGITWGLVEGFSRWQLQQGFAVSSVNVRLSTIKAYARLAVKTGSMPAENYALIRAVSGYSSRERKRIDAARDAAELPTRYERPGAKKAAPLSLTPAQAAALKAQPADLPQGRRDALLMCLLLDHGLRCGEAAGLQVTDFNLETGELSFYRPKVDLVQRHRLTADTLRAAQAYFEQDAPASGPLLRGSRKDGRLHQAGLSARAITARVKSLGEEIGIQGLSAHDCRHYWATAAARHGTQIDRLQQAGGWSSPAMPLRYVEAAKIANEGVKLGND